MDGGRKVNEYKREGSDAPLFIIRRFLYTDFGFKIAFRSSSAVVMGLMLKLLTRNERIFGVINAGKDGPSRISFIPRYNNDSRMTTAFCSYQESTSESGKSLIPQLNAPAKAWAIFTAE